MSDQGEGTPTFVMEETQLRVHAARFEVTAGPDAARVERIERPLFVVGTGTGADLRLSDGTVSREHVRLSLTPAGIHLRDGSKNGTWIGAMRVADVLLTADTVVTIGKTTFALRLETDELVLPLSAQPCFGEALGVSAPMRHLFATLERVARSDVSVLIEGESGVGKEVVARAIHAASFRASGPLVAVDCGAIPPTLIESELFGHERGAFTGATHARQGVFEQANGGTLFLDEIGELSLDMQPKLLRVLETREVRPVGGRAVRPFDIRLLAATNRRLGEAADKNEFRRDLFYRLAVARVTIPPLRDRPEDIPILARSFLRASTGDAASELPRELVAMLVSYGWPGNVRELRNVIERFAVLGARDAGTLFDSAHPVPTIADVASLPYHEARRRALDGFERDYIPKILARADGVVARAAELAQVARPSFYRLLERLRVMDGADRE